MKFQAVLKTTRELEKIRQSFHQTKKQAAEWARLALAVEPETSTVDVFELTRRRVMTVKNPTSGER